MNRITILCRVGVIGTMKRAEKWFFSAELCDIRLNLRFRLLLLSLLTFVFGSLNFLKDLQLLEAIFHGDIVEALVGILDEVAMQEFIHEFRIFWILGQK
jgi:hypothetical protein